LHQKSGRSTGLSGEVLVYGECVTPPIPAQYVPQSIHIPDPPFRPRTPTFPFYARKMDLSRDSLTQRWHAPGCAVERLAGSVQSALRSPHGGCGGRLARSLAVSRSGTTAERPYLLLDWNTNSCSTRVHIVHPPHPSCVHTASIVHRAPSCIVPCAAGNRRMLRLS
jgi:hypothetical protein